MSNWLRFLRHYGPIPRNDNMYDETIQRSARRLRISAIEFEHPYHDRVLKCFDLNAAPISVILTGTAGDGKTHLCRQVWELLGGSDEDWGLDSPYLTIKHPYSLGTGDEVTVHIIRDLSAWAPQQGAEWETDKEDLLAVFCSSLFSVESRDIFLIAANDGQLVESWRRLKETDDVRRARQLFEDLLVEDRQEQAGLRLKFFNLSRADSAELFDRALNAFVAHPGWQELMKLFPGENDLWGPKCPIRHNYELLQTELVRSRLRSLLELCDNNGLHLPIRQILLLLSNAVLGHPNVKDHLMVPADVPRIIKDGAASQASLYNNIFGGNLSENRRQGITIFDYLERFQIGHETSNRIDNILIFGEGDEHVGKDFDALVAQDLFYGADALFYAAKREYIEGTNEGNEGSQEFLQLLTIQRRGLFFKIPKESESDLRLWELSVFKFAGEYLDSVVGVVRQGSSVKRPIVSRLIRGLNRVFTGMLINSDRELYLATSGNYSQAKVSRILLERVSVEPSKGEKIILHFDELAQRVTLSVFFTPTSVVPFNMNLIRYEFLSRIASEGALPASFSKECYEDLLAFKSRLIAAYSKRQAADNTNSGSTIGLNLLALTEYGMPDPKFVEIVP
jgi:hypothetical protein